MKIVPTTVRLMPSSAYSGGRTTTTGSPNAAIAKAGDANPAKRAPRGGAAGEDCTSGRSGYAVRPWRSNVPGVAPVHSPSSNVTSPLTTVRR